MKYLSGGLHIQQETSNSPKYQEVAYQDNCSSVATRKLRKGNMINKICKHYSPSRKLQHAPSRVRPFENTWNALCPASMKTTFMGSVSGRSVL